MASSISLSHLSSTCASSISLGTIDDFVTEVINGLGQQVSVTKHACLDCENLDMPEWLGTF